MKAPNKGGGYDLRGYGRVVVKRGPSPERQTVVIDIGPVETHELEEIPLTEFRERRLR